MGDGQRRPASVARARPARGGGMEEGGREAAGAPLPQPKIASRRLCGLDLFPAKKKKMPPSPRPRAAASAELQKEILDVLGAVGNQDPSEKRVMDRSSCELLLQPPPPPYVQNAAPNVRNKVTHFFCPGIGGGVL